MADQNRIAQMLEVLADNGFGMYDLAMLFREFDDKAIAKHFGVQNDDDELETRIRNILEEIPIHNHTAVEYLVTGIKLSYKFKSETDQNLTYLNKRIGEVHKVSENMVNRAICIVLVNAWRELDEKAVKKYGLEDLTKQHRYPTSTMLIIAITNYLLKEDCSRRK